MRYVKTIVLLTCLIPTSTARAESGISELARARAFWVKRPYALVKSGDKDIRPDTVSLVRARNATFRESHGFIHDSICGIMPTDNLVIRIKRYAVTGRFILTENHMPRFSELGGNMDAFAVVDLENPQSSVNWFSTLNGALAYCRTGGFSGSLKFTTFDESVPLIMFRGECSFRVCYWPAAGITVILLGLWITLMKAINPGQRRAWAANYLAVAALVLSCAGGFVWLYDCLSMLAILLGVTAVGASGLSFSLRKGARVRKSPPSAWFLIPAVLAAAIGIFLASIIGPWFVEITL